MTSDEPIIVVSGLPRSGTSLMMQILQAGGIPAWTDHRRAADVSNPRGYFEHEKVKWLAADNSWIGEARGHAVKVIAQLIPFLPRGLPYQVLFMERDLDEVLQSQKTMIAALGSASPRDSVDLRPIFQRQLAAAQEFVQGLPGSIAATFAYRELVTAPESAIEKIACFLGNPHLDRRAMAAVVDRSLYRSRAEAPGS